MSDSRKHDLDRIRRAAASVELRMRLQRALGVLPVALTSAIGAVVVALTVRKVWPDHFSEPRARQVVIGAGVLFAVWILAAMVRRLPPLAGTVALDKHHRLHDRLTSALAFQATPEAERTAMMEAAIDDACGLARDLRPGRAAPLAVSAELLIPLLAALGLAGIAVLEVRYLRAPPPQKTIDALAMSEDDLELFRDAAKDLAKRDQSPEVKAAVDRFNQLIEDIAQKRLDRTEAFRRMEALERELLQGTEADAKDMEEALKDAASELKKSDLAKPVGESLEKKDLDQAKKDLEKLADKLRDKKKIDKASLERLKAALEKAAARQKEALAAINEKREEVLEDLLKKKNEPKSSDPKKAAEQERQIKKKERELERLQRESERKERTGRELDKLDRELAKAAEDLMRDLGDAAKDLDQAAEDINRMQEQEMSDKDKEELKKKLEELREVLRQQGQGGKERMARMLKFGKRARGGQGGQKGEKGEQGQGQEGQEGQGGQEGQEGEGKEGQGQGKPGGKGEQWVIGPGGKKILMPGSGQGKEPGGQGQGEGQGQEGQGQGQGDKPGGSGQDPGGDSFGSGRGGEIAGKKTDPKVGTSDVQAQGLDTKEGPTNSEVILSAAERGFKGSGYKKVYTKYHTVAEADIQKDQIPDGYRSYVHRYFQLIRPRD